VNHWGKDVKGIALLADRHTATCFKLAGLRDIFYIEDTKEAEKKLLLLLEKKDIKIILVSEQLINKTQIIEKIAQPQSPLVITIPTLRDQKMIRTDLIADLIRLKTGIEVKI